MRRFLGTVALVCVLLGATTAVLAESSSREDERPLVRIGLHSWVGYRANAEVVRHLLENRLGYRVELVPVDEEHGWKALAAGTLDALVENWGHEDLAAVHVHERATVVDGGPTGNTGTIGWYVPEYLVEQYPGITDWRNLNRYAHLFATPQSAGRGRLLAASPSYVTRDQALISNLGLNYVLEFAGSEDAEIDQVRKLYAQRKPVLFYFYEPQWLTWRLRFRKIELPAHRPGCDADEATVACDYPVYRLNKLFSRAFADGDSPAYRMLRNFRWTDADQATVAAWMAGDRMSPEKAARRWVQAHQDVWREWMSGVHRP
ncbi:ABC transporter substrate-binding protein [Planobispora longispora]|uniref:Glycine/betaine-binding protein n=1 Tax=Planobispora longispora TaxID=28887 RepID=A0A8J3S0E1_9ACTN|nr:ABC transporter substrate-binding protein [Planobispora longispora]BFE78492.1 ABC transporter substrate-binding protein [Planobispora longispora]GIH81358.1 glycine/betaine-binding protein [Planobispora longispora]